VTTKQEVNVTIDWQEYYPWYYLCNPKKVFRGSAKVKMTQGELNWVRYVIKEHEEMQKFMRKKGGWKG